MKKAVQFRHFSNRGRKRPPPFAKLYRVVYLGIHFRIAGIREN